MNFLQAGIQKVINWSMWSPASKDVFEETNIVRQQAMLDLIKYYEGDQRKPMKLTGLGKDYNVITNHAKTIVDRSVSMLVGAGVEFDLPGEGETPQEILINTVWDANKKAVLLHDLVMFGSIYGTPAIKIVPNGRTALNGTITYRLVALNPFNLSIFTNPNDIEDVQVYVFRWMDGDTNWREITRKSDNGMWEIVTEKADRSSAGKWVATTPPVLWAYPFAPIVHGKNLPNAGNIYGYSDIESIIDLQDKYNEAQTNINKILALQAWAQKYVTGGKFPHKKDDKGWEYIDAGPDKALEISGDNAKVGILQPSGDLSSSRQFANDLRRDLFDTSATVDAEMLDKVGTLTNFGLRVLFKNELAKNSTKQLLYGDLLLNVNNRLLQLSGYSGEQADPGIVIWGDALPVNQMESIQVLTQELNMGLVSKETAAEKQGYDWEAEEERIAADKSSQTNLGAMLLNNFNQGV